MALIQIPQPKPYIHQGPTVQQTVPPLTVTAREPAQFWVPRLRDPNLLSVGNGNTGPEPQRDGPTVQQTNPPQFTTRTMERYFPRPQFPLPVLPQPSVAVDTTPIAFTTRTFERYFPRPQYPMATLPQPSAVVDTTPILFTTRTFERYFARPQYPMPAVPQSTPVVDLLPTLLSQPIGRVLVRTVPDIVPRFDGATVQDWFLYPTNQPDLPRSSALHLRRFVVEPILPIDGPTTQQTYIFAVSLADWRNAVRLIQPAFAFPQDVPIVVAPDTLVYAQPLTTARVLVRAVNEIVPQFHGATSQDWFLYPTAQPDTGTPPLLARVRQFPIGSGVAVWMLPSTIPPISTGLRLILVDGRLAVRLHGILYEWLG